MIRQAGREGGEGRENKGGGGEGRCTNNVGAIGRGKKKIELSLLHCGITLNHFVIILSQLYFLFSPFHLLS